MEREHLRFRTYALFDGRAPIDDPHQAVRFDFLARGGMKPWSASSCRVASKSSTMMTRP
jgi:hypothetical protein